MLILLKCVLLGKEHLNNINWGDNIEIKGTGMAFNMI
jgi:hypothetical protein